MSDDGPKALLPFDVEVVAEADLDVVGASEAWSLYLADKAELTRQNYERDLTAFAAFVGQASPLAGLAWLFRQGPVKGNQVVHAYKAHLLSVPVDGHTGYAPATVRRRIYALRAIFGRARSYRLVDWNLDIELPAAEPQRRTRGPGPDGYATVLGILDAAIAAASEAGDKRKLEIALRDRVLIRLLHDSGLRRNEATGIEWPAGVRMDTEPEVLVLGKGRRRYQWVPISTPCRDQIRAYLDVRGKRAGYLLAGTGPHAGRLNKSTVNRRVSYWAAQAGVPFTPHGLRHTATTTALDAENGDKRLVKRWSRHRAEASLEPYDDRRRQDDRRIAELLSDPSSAEPHS